MEIVRYPSIFLVQVHKYLFMYIDDKSLCIYTNFYVFLPENDPKATNHEKSKPIYPDAPDDDRNDTSTETIQPFIA